MRIWLRTCLCTVILLLCFITSPAHATLHDDHYDGNIFALYGGNGSLVPPRVTLMQSFDLKRPALLAFYLDDSFDCKLYTPLLNQVQAFYGREVSIIPVIADSLDLESPTHKFTEEAYYYRGVVPQTVLVDPSGKVWFDQEGKPSFEVVDVAIRQALGLPAPSPSDPTQQLRNSNVKQINEINP